MVIKVFYTDSDWVGGKLTRKSTSNVVSFVKNWLLFDGARTQAVLAQSSGESQTCGAVASACPGLLVHALLAWFDFSAEPLSVSLDSKAATAMIVRTGVYPQHLEVKSLWTQSLAMVERLRVHKVPGGKNGAGPKTKVHPRSRFEQLCQRSWACAGGVFPA